MKLEGKQASPKSGNETFRQDIVKENNQKGLKVEEKGHDVVKDNNQKGLKVEEKDYVDRFLCQTNDQAGDYNHDLTDNSKVELGSIATREEHHEMPEVTICYEEDEISNAVKDICVDEGVPVHDKFLFDTSTMDDYLSTFLPPGKVIKGQELDKEPVIVDDVIPENPPVSKISKDKGSEDAEKIHSVEIKEEKVEPLVIHSVEIKEEEVDESLANSASNALKRSQSLGDLLALPEPSTDATCPEPFSSQTSGSIRRHGPDDNPDLSAATSTSHEELENDSKGPSSSMNSIASTSKEPSNTAATTVHESDQEAERHSMDSMSDDLTNEVAGRLSFDNRVSNAAEIRLPDPDHVLKPQLLTSSIAGTDSNRIRYNIGDSSRFSVVAATEPVPYSGSISMRSDSSTTSARSFAFPVLQSEWNSSPVRMAKADRRRLRHRRWKSGILCCKF